MKFLFTSAKNIYDLVKKEDLLVHVAIIFGAATLGALIETAIGGTVAIMAVVGIKMAKQALPGQLVNKPT